MLVRLSFTLLALLTLCAATACALAQSYPAKNIRLVDTWAKVAKFANLKLD